MVGNSGSGKDSIMKGVLEKFPPTLKKPIIVQRYITRLPSETEKNICLSTEEFLQMKNNGKFALTWHIYGLDYGVPIEIDDWLTKGHPVIVNVSRTIIQSARQIYKKIKVIFIEVPFEISLERLIDRGRETGKGLNERIARAKENQKLPEADFIVNNSGNLDNAIDAFLEYLIKTIKS